MYSNVSSDGPCPREREREAIDIRLKITLIDDGDLQAAAMTRQLSFIFTDKNKK